ncbi:MAG: PEP-CTERM sorting domain-containing protein [Chroococcidiopsidaceae cyanobacterium CP_BM_ER_R8_30]|nr:PEP-CTERM sorting domain-containing protein [Chroococcidiopsidaceae cyanobacterium CP_BM_ER_R8_30]
MILVLFHDVEGGTVFVQSQSVPEPLTTAGTVLAGAIGWLKRKVATR